MDHPVCVGIGQRVQQRPKDGPCLGPGDRPRHLPDDIGEGATFDQLKNEPELANNEPYGDGWMLRVTMRDAAEIENLMDASAYEGFLKDGG